MPKTTKQKIHEKFDRYFSLAVGYKKNEVEIVDFDYHAEELEKIKSFYDFQIKKLLAEIVPDSKSRLANVLIGRNDKIFSENGMDGIIGFNAAIKEINQRITQAGF